MNRPGVFILFADVCQSTVLYDRLGDQAAAELMMRCLALASEQVAAHSGSLIDTRGDEALCVFDGALDALAMASAVHSEVRSDEQLKAHNIAFRIGVHCGDIIAQEGSIYGDAVNVAARVAAKAKANQTVFTSSVAQQTSDELAELIRPLGESSVRGKRDSEPLFELLNQSSTEDITEVSAAALSQRRSFLLVLTHRNRQTRLMPTMIRFLLGRDKDCDLRIDQPSVSRHHAEIRFRNGHFFLFDVSTNGTRVQMAGGTVTVHRSELRLRGRGWIALGRTESNVQLRINYSVE